jgi:hypothetical protein
MLVVECGGLFAFFVTFVVRSFVCFFFHSIVQFALRFFFSHVQVRSRREFIVPNRGFLSQLMREEWRLFPHAARTLGWHEVRTSAKCLSHWLAENATHNGTQ